MRRVFVLTMILATALGTPLAGQETAELAEAAAPAWAVQEAGQVEASPASASPRITAPLAAAAANGGTKAHLPESPDNRGREFFLAFMDNLGTPRIELFISGDVATTGLVEVPALGFSQPFSVTPGSITSVTVPSSARLLGSDVLSNRGVRISADEEVVVYGLNQVQFTTDAFLGLPVDILGTEYILLGRNESLSARGLSPLAGPSELAVVAVEDATTVTITPSISTGSRSAGVPYSVSLDRFGTYQLQSDGALEDVTGTLVTSDKPVAVFAGGKCIDVPDRVAFCDHLVEQMPPTVTWGTSFLTVSLETRAAGDLFRVLARDDGTEVSVDGAPLTTLAAREFVEVDLASDTTHLIETTGPALVVQYAKGTNADGRLADPFMLIVPPTGQFLTSYTVSTPAASPVAFNNFINIVALTDDLATCTLDGAPFSAAFTPIGATGFSAGQQPVSIGTHNLACDSPFGIYSYGWASFDSYGYPGGLALRPIAIASPPVALCQDVTVFTDPGICSADAGIDAGSFDPQAGELVFTIDPLGPYSVGDTTVSLTVENEDGASASCEGTVTVVDPEPPAIACNAPPILAGDETPLTFTATAEDNCQPPQTVTVEITEATCLNADRDGDGIPDDDDTCPDSDTSEVLTIVDCITGVSNFLFDDGCTFSDLIFECGEDAANHGQFVSCVAHLTNDWKSQGLITGQEKGAIQSCAAQADIPEGHPGGGNKLASKTADLLECEAVIDGDEVSFPEPPRSGFLSWTITATDESANTSTQTCDVTLQNPDTPLPNLPPVADAGPDRLARVGDTVVLDGSGSADLDGDPITYQWTLTSAPAGSTASLSEPAASQPTLTVDRRGEFVAELVVSDGTASSTADSVTVTVRNSRPTADAGADQQGFAGELIQLDGSGSTDPDGDALTYQWTLAFVPEGSAAALSDPAAVQPTFTADVRGTYVAQLAVSDGDAASPIDAVIVHIVNTPPAADAGADQQISVFDTVQLDGSGSSDADGDPLTYQWALVARPAGSAAALSNATAVDPFFVADLAGTYEIELVVNDGFEDSAPDAVSIVTVNTPPSADAGPDQTAFRGDTVQLDGSGSSDVDGDALTYQWTFVSRPASSAAALSDPVAVDPTFVADFLGAYEVELVANDGQRPSLPDTVTVTVVNRPPVADAGPDQTGFLGDTAQLDASGSFDPDGDPLTFAWSFDAVPAGSGVTLSDPSSVAPTFVPDVRGAYIARVTVIDSNGDSGTDTLVYIVPNRPPIADAGPDQGAFVTETVFLDGSGSSDADGDPLTFSWSIISVPAGSSAALSEPAAVNPSFVVDAAGTYVVQLVVDDGFVSSSADTVTIDTLNSPPVADAGPDQEALPGDTVQLDGSGSSDVDGDSLTYAWAFVSLPTGSAAALSDPAAVNPTFMVDEVGAYVVELVVSDGDLSSGPDTVTITTGNVAPVADAGPDQTAFVGDTVQLDGSGSSDANGDPLTYAWSFVSVPAGSTAALSDPAAVAPSFVIDVFGTYVVQLIVDDGEFSSAPDTVTIDTQNSRPVAIAGPDQVVLFGTTVFLDGAGSFDADGDPLTFSWSLIAVPPGSAAALSDPAAVDPFFDADLAGAYVAQLIVSDGDLDSLPDTVMIEASYDLATVPDVVGLQQVDAEAAIVAEGLVVGTIATVPSNVVPAGEVLAQDPAGGTTVLGGTAVDLVVSLGPDPTVVGEIVVLPASDTILVGGGRQFTAFGIRGDGTSVDLTTTAAWSSSDPGVATVGAAGLAIGAGAGAATVTASFAGVSGSAGLTVEATVADGVPPTAEITSPADNSTLISPVDVIGTADDANFLKYELAISPAGDGTFTTIGTGTAPVVNGVIGTFDPTVLLNGLYDVLLRVFDRGGFISSTVVSYQVAGDQKVGNFSLTFTDLDIPVAGLPVTIQRTYDSRDKRRGDFGVGWRLAIQTLEVSDNGLQGDNWSVSRSGGFLPTYFLQPSRAHIVSLTLADGTVEEFDFTPQPSSSLLLPFTFVSPAYTPRSGTLGQLSAPFADLLVNGSQPGVVELVDLDDFGLYDPKTFFYTTVDGRIFTINKTSGVTSIREPNGNTLTINASGVFHSSGTGVSFTRDGLGRVTAMTDPNGNVQTYEYDGNGDLSAYVDAEGNRTTYRYNFSHGLLDIEDPRGISPARYEYDDDGRLVAIVDPDGNRVEIDNDVVGRQQIVTDRRGNATIYVYDDNGNVLSQTDALGNTVGYTADSRGNELTVTDALGNTSSRTYDSRDNILTESDPLGNTVSRTYDARSRLLAETDANGDTTTNTYDANGNPLTTTDALGNTMSNAYDAQGNRLTSTDEIGNSFTYEYDGAGRRTRYVDANGNQTTYTYDGNGNRLTETSTRTAGDGSLVTMTTSLVYDGNNRLLRQIDPLGNVSSTEYTANGKEAALVDKNGNRTEFEYDARGNVVRATYADGTQELTSYDAEFNRTSSTDRAGRTTTYEYDAVDRLVRTVHPGGSDERVEYDAAGRVTARIDGNGNRTEYEYAAAGRQIGVIDALGNTTTYTYDPAGNRTGMTDARGNTTTFEYDAKRRQVRTNYADGTFATVAYDGAGRKTAETDQAGIVTQFEYDPLGKLTRVLDAAGGQTLFTYDEAGNKISQTDANGNATTWSYDSLGRVTGRTMPLGMTESFTFDGDGNMLSRTDFNGQTTTFTYDSNDRVTRKVYPDGSDVRWTYTATGQLATAVDSRGTTTHTYDLRDRLIRVVEPDGAAIDYTYAAAGNRTSVTTAAGTATTVYDALNRPVSVTAPDGGVTTYTYDAVGNRASLAHPNGTVAEYTYDSLNRLTLLINRQIGGAVISSYGYTLGPAGNRTGVVESSGRTVDYDYDALYRLTRELVTEPGVGTTVTDYVYDAVGNRLTRTIDGTVTSYTYDANDRLLTEDATIFAYDDNGNRIRESTVTDTFDFEYDYDDRLIRADTRDPGTSQVEYAYDPVGRRVLAIVDGVDVTRYLVDTQPTLAQVLLETDSAGAVLASYVQGDDLLSMTRSGAVSYYHYDGQMSTRQLTDAAGAVTDTYTYDAFGELSSSTGSTVNDYLFTGEEYDPNVGFYYLRARYYDPSDGRFVSMDTFTGSIFEPLSLHRYLYTEASPIDNVDPTGLYLMSVAISIPIRTITISLPSYGAVLLAAQQAAVIVVGAAVAACAVTSAISTFTSAFSGSPCDFTNFNIFFSGGDTPKTTQHIADALLSGQPAILHRVPRKPSGWIHSTPACIGNVASVSGDWCDEYPFATSAEGGPGASTRLVPRWEQLIQAGKLSAFYRLCSVKQNDPIDGAYGVVPQPGPSAWVCK